MGRFFPAVDTLETNLLAKRHAASGAMIYATSSIVARGIPAWMHGIAKPDADVALLTVVYAFVSAGFAALAMICAHRLAIGKGVVITSVVTAMCALALLCDILGLVGIATLLDAMALYGLINGLRALAASRRLSCVPA